MIAAPCPDNHEPYDEIIEVTSDVAYRWLEGNTHNRPVNDAHVKRLAADIRANRWRLTHQGIAFDTEGLLIDGQHRLWAVIEAGIPVRMRVFFNEPPENKSVVDSGQRRSNLDILNITGEVCKVTSKHLATLRAMLAGRFACPVQKTPGEEADLYNKYRNAVDFAVEHLPASTFKGIATATVRAVIARAFYSCDSAKLAYFCEALKAGPGISDADSPVCMLFKFLLHSNDSGNKESVRRLRYAKVEWALNAYLKGKTPQRLFSSEEELFPLHHELLGATA